MCRYFRVYRAPDGYEVQRIAAGSDGSAWLVMVLPATASQRAALLVGTYRGLIRRVGQPLPPNWPKTCAEVDPGCADGGCDAGLTRCVRCAGPRYVMGGNRKVGRSCIWGCAGC